MRGGGSIELGWGRGMWVAVAVVVMEVMMMMMMMKMTNYQTHRDILAAARA